MIELSFDHESNWHCAIIYFTCPISLCTQSLDFLFQFETGSTTSDESHRFYNNVHVYACSNLNQLFAERVEQFTNVYLGTNWLPLHDPMLNHFYLFLFILFFNSFRFIADCLKYNLIQIDTKITVTFLAKMYWPLQPMRNRNAFLWLLRCLSVEFATNCITTTKNKARLWH